MHQHTMLILIMAHQLARYSLILSSSGRVKNWPASTIQTCWYQFWSEKRIFWTGTVEKAQFSFSAAKGFVQFIKHKFSAKKIPNQTFV